MRALFVQARWIFALAFVFLVSSHCSVQRRLMDQRRLIDLDGARAAYNRGDYATAFEGFSMLAEQGDPKAQFNLGLMYQAGHGVSQDYGQAAFWFHKAAEQGIAAAQNNLGLLYHDGRGVPQDYAQAAGWFRRAAEQGDPQAQNNLGVMYYRSEEVPRDYVQAYMWFKLSAGAGNISAAKRCDFLAKKMTAKELEEAERLVKTWRPKKEGDQP